MMVILILASTNHSDSHSLNFLLIIFYFHPLIRFFDTLSVSIIFTLDFCSWPSQLYSGFHTLSIVTQHSKYYYHHFHSWIHSSNLTHSGFLHTCSIHSSPLLLSQSIQDSFHFLSLNFHRLALTLLFVVCTQSIPFMLSISPTYNPTNWQ